MQIEEEFSKDPNDGKVNCITFLSLFDFSMIKINNFFKKKNTIDA
jgi:hypothetical protein